MAQAGKLKALKHYWHPAKQQSAQDMAAMIQELGRKSNMKVRQVTFTDLGGGD